MGWWDDLVKKTTREATKQSGKLAARQALRAAQAAVGGLADDFLSAAEGELEEAQAKREGRTNPVAHLTEDGEAPAPPVEEQTVEPEDHPEAVSTLEPLPSKDPHADRPPAVRARLEREERARRELEALKAQLQGPSEDKVVKKTL